MGGRKNYIYICLSILHIRGNKCKKWNWEEEESDWDSNRKTFH